MHHPKDQLPILEFKDQAEWEQWLKQHHTQDTGIWIRFYKKAADVTTIVYAEALDAALCYGWIDGLANKYDDVSYLQRFTKRRARSIWSKRNIEYVQRLIDEGRMQPAGLKELEAARQDGRLEVAYDKPSEMKVPDDFLEALNKDKVAKEFFATLNKTNLYAIAWRLQTAKKPATRQKRMETILAMLSQKQKFH